MPGRLRKMSSRPSAGVSAISSAVMTLMLADTSPSGVALRVAVTTTVSSELPSDAANAGATATTDRMANTETTTRKDTWYDMKSPRKNSFQISSAAARVADDKIARDLRTILKDQRDGDFIPRPDGARGLHAHQMIPARRENQSGADGDRDTGYVAHAGHAACRFRFVQHQHAASGRRRAGQHDLPSAAIPEMKITAGRHIRRKRPDPAIGHGQSAGLGRAGHQHNNKR